jgi:hypothetical protein
MTKQQQFVAALLGAVVWTSVALSGEPPQSAPKPSLPKIDEKVLADPKAAETAAALLEAAYQDRTPPEAMRMLLAILRGKGTGTGEGWFGPAEMRYTWKWLAETHGVDPAKGFIARTQFRGSSELFARLDRDKDGRITADDFDWSEHSPYMQLNSVLRGMYRRLNAAGNGKLTKEELVRFYEKAAEGKEALTFDEFRDSLLAGRAPRRDGPAPGLPKKAAAMRSVLVRGLFAGEIGSMNEGPHVGQPAPNFTLRTIDGKQTVQLANVLGKKPVVLVFGNYTCGPFTAAYPDVEPVYERFKNDATFLLIYVREAHPTDGWNMGAPIAQPKSYEERVGVAQQFCKRVTPTMPVLVDEINDPVGHAYSGMPSRLYVIDTQGIVAYKSGRGPFGFRVGEMEQALVMTLLDARNDKRTAERDKAQP